MADWDKSAEPPPSNPTVALLHVGLGVGLVFLGHGLLFGLLLLGVSLENRFARLASGACLRWSDAALQIGVVALLALSVTQLVYVVPLFVAALRIRRRIALGVVLAAVVTVLAQGACYWVASLGDDAWMDQRGFPPTYNGGPVR